MFRIQTLNNISRSGLDRLPGERYQVATDMLQPDAILLRSADMHALELPASLKAVARAGAGTNNVPVDALSTRGVPVFNAPGANANAVKELVIAGMLIQRCQVEGSANWDIQEEAKACGSGMFIWSSVV